MLFTIFLFFTRKKTQYFLTASSYDGSSKSKRLASKSGFVVSTTETADRELLNLMPRFVDSLTRRVSWLLVDPEFGVILLISTVGFGERFFEHLTITVIRNTKNIKKKKTNVTISRIFAKKLKKIRVLNWCLMNRLIELLTCRNWSSLLDRGSFTSRSSCPVSRSSRNSPIWECYFGACLNLCPVREWLTRISKRYFVFTTFPYKELFENS